MSCKHCGGPTKEIPGFNETYTVCATKDERGKTCDDDSKLAASRAAARAKTVALVPVTPTPDADGNVFGYGPWPHLWGGTLQAQPFPPIQHPPKKTVTQQWVQGEFDIPLWPPGSK